MLQPNDSSGASNGEETTSASLQPMGFTDILDSMFSLYRNHFRLFVSICSVYFCLRIRCQSFDWYFHGCRRQLWRNQHVDTNNRCPYLD